ncbi:helix-turn-helix transcriptional regulator [Amycolatopsis regifaucium]|uniref:Helix-turn-helix transcriptional regulator n=1 Tax=Amycolatopsis regifaucium TaxID=546365 RepID=A0A154MW64_9PSEU|nr:helix-turn-helix transcriptional regulator [Amycolatopsis regifaucium]KZB87997.1 helix-turn-helix transcriptional regulator [Amycolatopsis regifaucium]OKA04497.1 helix-turn-helix transcriptional regulator [Amycolatopsis regifaucium]SFH50622.1 regulatory protein, luxR family [Amycolatopsis regifaucium]
MTELDRPDDAEAAREALDAARKERARLGALGRWSEADEAAMSALRRILEFASPDIVGPELGGLVYVAGSPRPGPQTAGRHGLPVPPERLSATRAMSLVNQGNDPREAAELAHEALKSFNWRDVGTFWYAILSLAYLDDGALAQHHCERAMTRAGWAASPALTVLRARVAALNGDSVTAVRLLDPLVTRGVQNQFTEVAVAWAIEALVDLGDLDRADALMRAHAFSGNLDAVVDRAEVLAARGLLSRAIGQPEPAYEDFVACGRELASWGVGNPAVIPWRSRAALCAAATGRETIALPLAEEELSRARRWGTARAIGTALRTLGLVSTEGRDVELLKKAVELLADSGARNTLMEAQYELAVKLRLEGRHDEVQPALRGLRETALATGNNAWEVRADEALRRWTAAGETPKVSAKERKVANLAQGGLSNGEIAKRLQLTTSTVEFHLSNIYRKLAISGRSELRSILVPIR